MVAKRGSQMDKKNIVIFVLSLIICFETVLLYKSDPKRFIGFFVHRQKTTAQGKAATKKPVERVKPALSYKQTNPVAPIIPPAIPLAKGSGKVVIILDDWGYSTKNCQYLRDIKSPITVAVLPDLPHTAEVMQCAHDAGKEIMLHLPMEPHNNLDKYPEDYIIKTAMSPIKIDHLLSDILDKMPLVDGVNNHMGSKATEDRKVMTTVFRQLKHRKLFFVDSRVTAESVCGPLAKEIGVPFASRDVFLDNVNERAAIQAQLMVLARLAKKKGWAVAIGHDRTLTLQVIQEQVPSLRAQGLEFVTVKDIIRQ
jgi:uncharacterized protein